MPIGHIHQQTPRVVRRGQAMIAAAVVAPSDNRIGDAARLADDLENGTHVQLDGAAGHRQNGRCGCKWKSTEQFSTYRSPIDWLEGRFSGLLITSMACTWVARPCGVITSHTYSPLSASRTAATCRLPLAASTAKRSGGSRSGSRESSSRSPSRIQRMYWRWAGTHTNWMENQRADLNASSRKNARARRTQDCRKRAHAPRPGPSWAHCVDTCIV